MENNKTNQKVKIDRTKCFGCGACQSVCPEGFEIIDGKSKVKNADAECIEQAIKACPVAAITLE
jgi:ferredoxin